MRRSTKAALLSALVLPGAGHLYLKHFWRGIALVGVSLACMGVIAAEAMRQTSAALDKLVSEGGALDPNQLADLLTQTSSSPDGGAASLATLVLAGCWVVGIVDAYRLGKHPSGRPR